ncbi:MAG TPA: protein kinase [Trebonia sp.]|nr:protein kinase [Trebonia sp.]
MIKDLQSADPAKVGPYRLLGRLGAGGMGRVYVARSPGGRVVAIKVIRAELAEDRGFRDRFAREVAAARHVSGIFTAAVIDADPDGETPWMATAYVPGPSLADAIDEHGPLHADSVRALAAGLAEGLQAIHQAGLVHRDMKPSNVLLAADGPRVIDFGISRAVEGSRLTETGMLVGSPGFMSPEQARGLLVGAASDVFSLGAVLTFAATGEGPFGAGPTLGLMFRVVHEPPDLTRVPDELRPLLEACLAKEPADRPSPGQLLEFLSEEVGVLAPDWLPPAVTATFSQYVPVGQDALSGPRTAARPEQVSQPGTGYPAGSVPQTSLDPRTQGSAPQAPVSPVPTTLGNTPARGNTPAWAEATQAVGATLPPAGSATGPWAPGPAGPQTVVTGALQGPAPARRGRLRKRWLLAVAASVAAVIIVAGVATAVTRSSGGTHTVNTGQTTPAPNSSPSLDATATPTKTATPTPTPTASTTQPTATVAPTWSGSSPTPTWTTSPTPTSSWTSTATPTATATPTPTTSWSATAAPSSTAGGCSSGCTQSLGATPAPSS